MEYRAPGTRYRNLHRYDHIKHAPYDYKRHGLLNKILPSVITDTKNATTRIVLDFVEATAFFLLDYVDRLKQFKNPHFKASW
jgi:hypothetical protein